MTRVTGIGVEERQGRRRVTHVDTGPGSHHVRRRRERRRHVRPRDRADGRRQRAGRADGAPVRAHPPVAAHPEGPADDARSRSPRVLPGGGRRPGRRRLRARPRPVERRRRHPAHFNNTLLPPDWDRFLPLSEAATTLGALPGRRRGARSSSTARRRSRPTASSSWARARSPASSWPPASAPTASPAPAATARSWPSGSSAASRRPISGRWTSAASATSTAAGATRWPAPTRCTAPTTTSCTPTTSAGPAGRCAVPPAYTRHVGLGADLRREERLGAGQLVRSNDDRAHEHLRPRGWAGQHWSTAIVTEHLRLPRDGRAVRRVELRQDRGRRSRCRGVPPTPVRERRRPRRRLDHLHVDAQLARRHRVRLHRDPARGRTFPHRHRHGVRPPRPVVDRASTRPPSGTVSSATSRRRWPASGCGGPWRATSWSTSATTTSTFRYMQRPPHHRRRRAVLGAAGHLRRRARLGAVPADGVRATAVGHARGRPAQPTDWFPPATAPSTRCGWRRATGCGARTSRARPIPFSAGLGFAVRLRQGLPRPRRRCAARAGRRIERLVCLVLDDPRSVALGNEPVKDGAVVVGRVSSGGLGYSLGLSIAYAWLPAELTRPGTRSTSRSSGSRSAPRSARTRSTTPRASASAPEAATVREGGRCPPTPPPFRSPPAICRRHADAFRPGSRSSRRR